jgi:hypothetical protein
LDINKIWRREQLNADQIDELWKLRCWFNKKRPMAHEKRIVECSGPDAPHALDGIPVQLRRGELDAPCPECRGHGQWNTQIDLVSHRSIRACCVACGGHGWIETGNDPVATHDIKRGADGRPQWVVRLNPPR